MLSDPTFKSVGMQTVTVSSETFVSCKGCDSIMAEFMTLTYSDSVYSDTIFVFVNDTTFTTVFDTSYVSVNDTLVFELLAGIDDANVESVLVKVFPNPSTTTLNVSFVDVSVLSNLSLKLYDMTGKLVADKAVSQAACTIDISAFDAGSYLLNIVKDAVVLDNKVIIIK